jgi:hypothetical protein
MEKLAPQSRDLLETLLSWSRKSLPFKVVVVVHVDGVRTAATNGLFVRAQMLCKYGELRWNDIDRGKP